MRTPAGILLVVLFAGGCATRLPLERAAPAARYGTAAAPAPDTVSEADLRRAVEGIPTPDACFVRRGLEAEHGCREEVEECVRHEIALFLGYAWERGEGGATVGLDYAYWISERFGVGPFADYVAGEVDAFAFGAGAWVRPFRRLEDLTFLVAPGVDLTHEEEEDGDRSWEAKFLLRLGVTYAVVLGRGFRLVPGFYWDVIFPDKQAYVLGLSIGKEF